ncbi:MAG: APC family permease [Actinomycetota bacterium]|nr:APC family permease [Actinomycetota bacterium]
MASQQTTTASGPGGGPTLFTRNATGLVRELSAFDAFNLVFSAVLIPVGITEVMGFAPQFWPHANLFLAFLIATPLVACFGLVYLYFTSLMPRSGGDYVWVSRTLHPFLGFVVNFSLTFVFLTWVAFNFTFMLSIVLPAVGYVAGIHASWVTAPSHGEMMLIATILTVIFTAVMVVGVRSVARYMKVTFVIVWVGMAIWLLLMLFGSHSGFVTRWDHGAGASYAAIISSASRYGFHVGGGIALGATIAAMVYCFQVYTGFQWTGYFAGEIKNARRTAVTSIVGGLLASAVIYCIASLLVYKYFGFKFFGSLVYLGLGGGTSHYTLGFAPYLPQMVKFLPGGQVLQVVVVACFLLAIFWWTPTGFLLGTRNLFAWSFDRLAPTRVTDVSDRFHTPVIATVIIGLVVELLNYLNIYQGLGAFLLNVIVIMGLAFIVVSIAAGAVPYRRPAMHAEAPAWSRATILGVPAITLLSVVSALSWAFVIFEALNTGFGGALGWGPMIKVFVAPIIAAVWYVGVSAYRRSQGISLANTFREIPPE